MPQRRINTYHGTPNEWIPNELGELRYNPSKLYTGEGGGAYGQGFYQALDPEIALRRYAVRLSEGNKSSGYLLENTTNPDLYYYTNKPLKEQPRFIRNAIINEYNGHTPLGDLSKALDTYLDKKPIDYPLSSLSYNELYNAYMPEDWEISDNAKRWGVSYKEAEKLAKENAKSKANENLKYAKDYDGYWQNRVLPSNSQHFEYLAGKELNPDTPWMQLRQRAKELALQNLLDANEGEVPRTFLYQRNNAPVLKSMLSDGTKYLSTNEYNDLIDIIANHGGAGVAPVGATDKQIFVNRNPELTTHRYVNASNMDNVANMISKGELPKPFTDFDAPNLQVEPIFQTHKGKTLEDIKANAQEKYSNLKKAHATDKQINDMLYGKDKSILEPSFKPTETKLSTPAKSINKQTTVAKPKQQVKVPLKVTPKVTDVPLGARLYEAGLNPKELVKLAKDPKVLSEVTKSLGKAITNPKTYLELGRGLISPTNIGLIASDILVNKADQAVHNRLKGKYNIKSQAEFNKLYPTLSTFERGQLGNTYPEMYQTYMRGR